MWLSLHSNCHANRDARLASVYSPRLLPNVGLQLDPKDNYANQDAADSYEHLGRFDEARAILDRAAAQNLSGPNGSISRYELAFLRGDEAGMQAAMDAARGGSIEPVMFLLKGESQCAAGKIANSRQSFAQGASWAQKSGMKEMSSVLQLLDATCDVETGNEASARQKVSAALATSNLR